MRCEIPKLEKCCMCVPMRFGILAFGYLFLAFTVVILSVTMWMASDLTLTSTIFGIYRGANLSTRVWFHSLLLCSDIVFFVILIAGTHLHKKRLLHIFYYYWFISMFAEIVMYIFVSVDDSRVDWHNLLPDFGLILIGLVFQIYLLLLLRSYLKGDEEIPINQTEVEEQEHSAPQINGRNLP